MGRRKKLKDISLEEYKRVREEIALEIKELFKDKSLSVALVDDVLEYTKNYIHRTTIL